VLTGGKTEMSASDFVEVFSLRGKKRGRKTYFNYETIALDLQ
jgi:ATP-dependent Zn protease